MDTDTPKLLVNVFYKANSDSFKIYCGNEYSLLTLSLLLTISNIKHVIIIREKYAFILSKYFNQVTSLLYPNPNKH